MIAKNSDDHTHISSDNEIDEFTQVTFVTLKKYCSNPYIYRS